MGNPEPSPTISRNRNTDAVQRVDGGRLDITIWLKVYSSPITKVWVVTFDGDKSCHQQVATY